MYLMALTNLDYALVTLLFAVVFLLAYSFRHQNKTSQDFLSTANTKCDTWLAYLGDFGVIEIVLAGLAASYWGFNAIYYLSFAIIIELLCQTVLTKRYIAVNVTNCYDYLSAKCSNRASIVLALFNVLILVLLASLAIAITFKMLQALMGWNFVNSIMGLLGITVIYMIVGGYKGISRNKILNYVLVLGIILLGVSIGLSYLGNDVATNLIKLAQSRHKVTYDYFIPPFNLGTLTILTVLTIGLSGFNLLQFRQTPIMAPNRQLVASRALIAIGIRILIMVILLMPGILAIATPPANNTIAGKDIVTMAVQLPDGQTGYVVKTIDKTSKTASAIPGIITPLLNPKTNLVEPGRYNYMLASVVALHHYIPHGLSCLLLIIIMAGFMLSIADYLFKLSLVTLKHVLLPLKAINRYGIAGEIWTLRLAIIGFAALILAVGYYVARYADLLHYMAILVMLLISPLAAILLLIAFGMVGRHTVISSIVVGKVVAVSLFVILLVFSELLTLSTRCAVISSSSFVATVLTGLYLWRKYD